MACSRTLYDALGDTPGTRVVFWNYLMLIFTWIISGQVTSKAIGTERYEDKSFPNETMLLNHTVTCGKHTPGKFVAPTFTCVNLRVDGQRLAYGYSPGWSVGQEDQRCQETAGVHEFAQLCKMMLKIVGMEKLGFKAVYVPKSTCAYLNETRKLLKKTSEHVFQWTDFRPGWGWTDTIQCMTDYVDKHH